MRLSITLDDELYAVARSLAKAEDCSISAAVNALLRRGLEPRARLRRPTGRAAKLSSFPTSEGKRLLTEADVKATEDLP